MAHLVVFGSGSNAGFLRVDAAFVVGFLRFLEVVDTLLVEAKFGTEIDR